ncbi:hypothetical protein QZH41_001190 [Actinostola sp. cb2023]|nr:hypothetical protein QZH41_001190 [Actinostola sp. cb2023]
MLVAKEGQSLVIRYETSGFPKPTITWYKEHDKVDERLYETGVLRLTSVRFEDRGRYLCEAKNFIGKAEAFLELIVNVAPRFVVLPPVYQPGYESWDTTITCNIFGFPAPRVEWTRALQDMPKGRHIKSGKHLIIKKTHKDDKGPYMCKGINAFGSVFAMIVVTVHHVPLVNCGDPGAPNHGYRTGDEFWAGKMVIYACDPGYHLAGPSDRLCLATGHRLCPKQVPPDNAYIVGDQFWADKALIFRCKSGYWLRGTRQILCDSETGNWTDVHGNTTFENPRCKGHTMYSNILVNRTEYYDLLREWLAPVTGVPTHWATCYHTKNDGWSASTFHSRCNSIGPTITIIKVKDYIFGGYSDKDWRQRSFLDNAKLEYFPYKSFRFRMSGKPTNHDNLKPFKTKVHYIDNAVYGNGGYLPTFGGGHDVHIANNAGSNTNSYTNLGHSYIQLRSYKQGSAKAKNLLAGTYNFQPDEVEVFRQTDD